MKTTIVYAHPTEGSFNHAILEEVRKAIPNHYLIDLCKDGFNPVMSSEDLAMYNEGRSNDPLVKKYNEILDDTDRIIFIFPIYWYDMPAIMRGFMDKVMLSGSAYTTDETGLHALRHINKTVVFTASFATKDQIIHLFGDPMYGTLLGATFEMVGFHNAEWYNMDNIEGSSLEARKAFLADVKNHL